MLPARVAVALVPNFPQTEHTCGPAALAMALAWSGLSTSPRHLEPQVYTPGREGSLAADLATAARRRARLAVALDGLASVLAELAAGHPVVVLQNLGLDWVPRWHFAVAVGYDLGARSIRLHSGGDEPQELPLDTFEHTWRRGGGWALVVLPPDTLPAAAGELAVARAAAGLERAGYPGAAATAYRAMLDRWPDSLAASVGLGNALLAADERDEAVAWLRQAAARHPEWDAVRNNLRELSPRPAGDG